MRIILYFLKSLSLRCPHCRANTLVRRWYAVQERCSDCGYVFHGEQGDFWGGVVISYTFGGLIGLLSAAGQIGFGWFEVETRVYVSVSLAVLGIVLLFPVAKSAWIHIMYATRGHYAEYKAPEP